MECSIDLFSPLIIYKKVIKLVKYFIDSDFNQMLHNFDNSLTLEIPEEARILFVCVCVHMYVYLY